MNKEKDKEKNKKERKLLIQIGAALFVYTDGVVEARNADDEMYDVQRLIDYMNTLPDLPPAQLLESIHAHINEFVGDAPQFDDLTMLGLTLS